MGVKKVVVESCMVFWNRMLGHSVLMSYYNTSTPRQFIRHVYGKREVSSIEDIFDHKGAILRLLHLHSQDLRVYSHMEELKKTQVYTSIPSNLQAY